MRRALGAAVALAALLGTAGCFDQDDRAEPIVPEAPDTTDGTDDGGERSGTTGTTALERDDPLTQPGPAAPDWTESGVPVREPSVIESYPHDPARFTQGLDAVELPSGDVVTWEGTGLVGQSQTFLLSGPENGFRTELAAPLGDGSEFGEGVAFVPGPDRTDPIDGGFLVQLTWQDRVAYLLDPETLEQRERLDYDRDGWGICWLADPPAGVPDPGDRGDGSPWGGVLATTDGSSGIVFRHPETLEPIGAVRAVTPDGEPVRGLNELDCHDGRIWANVWGAEWLAAFDAADGTLVEVADLSGLRPLLSGGGEVLNGITRLGDGDRWLATGKRWSELFEIELPAPTG